MTEKKTLMEVPTPDPISTLKEIVAIVDRMYGTEAHGGIWYESSDLARYMADAKLIFGDKKGQLK